MAWHDVNERPAIVHESRLRGLAVFVWVVGVSRAFLVVYFVVECFHMGSAESVCSLFVQRAVGPVSMKRFASSLV